MIVNTELELELGVWLEWLGVRMRLRSCTHVASSLVPRPHPLRGEGSGEKPWIMTSFCNVIINYYNYEIDRTRHERDTEV